MGARLLNSKVEAKDCTGSVGYSRIFTEHTETGTGAGSSNLNHAFELHPALRIVCDGQAPIEFFKALSAPAGLRHIKAVSAASCLVGRTPSMRFKSSQYEFEQQRWAGVRQLRYCGSRRPERRHLDPRDRWGTQRDRARLSRRHPNNGTYHLSEVPVDGLYVHPKTSLIREQHPMRKRR